MDLLERFELKSRNYGKTEFFVRCTRTYALNNRIKDKKANKCKRIYKWELTRTCTEQIRVKIWSNIWLCIHIRMYLLYWKSLFSYLPKTFPPLWTIKNFNPNCMYFHGKIEKQSPLKGFPYWLKVSPLYHDWLRSFNWKKG